MATRSMRSWAPPSTSWPTMRRQSPNHTPRAVTSNALARRCISPVQRIKIASAERAASHGIAKPTCDSRAPCGLLLFLSLTQIDLVQARRIFTDDLAFHRFWNLLEVARNHVL